VVAQQTLGAFLRARRAQVDPDRVGLPNGSRRRVPGLRREELAQLAGISVEYYQRLEQGRATRPSDEVLDALGRALGLDDVERLHLGSLAAPKRRDQHQPASRARTQLVRMLALMDRVPALVVTDCFDVLAANPLAAWLLLDNAAPQSEPPNLAQSLFLDPAARDLYVEWDEVAAATAGQLRLTSGNYPADRRLGALIAELIAGSEEFRTLWCAAHVHQRSCGVKSFRHPAVGVLTLHYENFASLEDTRQRLVVFTPEADSATEAALQLVARWTAG
jgi:transcriptional regulator with XRE-family HTH domain